MTDIKRDRWGRALIPHPLPDGKPAPHKRPSSVAMKIADRFNLEEWAQRMVAKGIAERPDLVALAHTADPDTKEGKQALDRVAGDAKEAARSSKGANLGTAIHTYVEAVNNGQDVTPLTQYAGTVDAYRRLLDIHRIVPHTVEQFVVWPDKQIAGTRDLVADIDGRRAVIDLKTGQHNPADWSMVEYAAQLACYANATHLWDGATAVELEPCDTDTAYIIWLPAGGDRAELIEVDIVKGARWVDLALEVDAAQKDRKVAATVTAPAAPLTTSEIAATVTETGGDRVEWIRSRLTALIEAGHGETVARRWPDGCPTLKPSNTHTETQLDDIVALLDQVGAAVGEPLTVDPATSTTPAALTLVAPAPTSGVDVLPDDGPATHTDIAAQLRKDIAALDDNQRANITRWVIDCADNGYSLNIKTDPVPLRRWLIVSALVAAADLTDEDMALILHAVTGTHPESIVIGAELAQLTVNEADLTGRMTRAYGTAALEMTINETTGLPSFDGEAMQTTTAGANA